LRHPLDTRRLEQVARVLHRPVQDSVALAQHQAQVELRALAAHPFDFLGHDPRQLPLRRRHVVQHHRHLEQRIARKVALGGEFLHHLPERHILVRERRQRLLAHARKQGRERRRTRQVAAHHQRVDEEADQPFQLRARASGGGHAHRDVLLPAVARQQHVERRQERHEQRRPFAPRQRLQRLQQRGGQLEGDPCAAMARHRRAPAIGRQVEHRHPGQRLPPIGELALQRFPLQPLPLPHRVVGILHRQLGQRRRRPCRERCIQLRHLAHQHAHRPAVGDDVVYDELQPVMLRGDRVQAHAPQRRPGEVEPGLGFAMRAGQRLVFADRLGGQLHRKLALDDLHRRAVDQREARAQRLVTRHQRLQRSRQR